MHYTYTSATNMTRFINFLIFSVCFDIIKRFHADECIKMLISEQIKSHKIQLPAARMTHFRLLQNFSTSRMHLLVKNIKTKIN